jgi:peptidoglycan-associated lipoprotein
MITMHKRKISVLLLGFSLFLLAAGCKKKVAPPPPPPPPPPKEEPAPPPKPSISSFTVEPSTIERGQSATMRWDVANATDISISPGVGTVQARGSRQVFPSQTTTYHLTAKGPGGSDERTATVTVTVPPPPPPPPPPPKKSLSERLSSEVQDAFFDYDKSDIREDARATLARNADALKQIFREIPDGVVTIEGHCDERGSAEYNLGLGDRRATAAREYLVQMGVPDGRLKTISYGKERPQCTESNEDCWQRNRRAHFVAGQ